jgi:sulfur carrier protein ThiS
MKIKVKLGGRLKDYLPKADKGLTELTTSANITVAEAMSRFQFAEDIDGLLVIVEGENIPPSQRADYALQNGQLLNVLPPLKGG